MRPAQLPKQLKAQFIYGITESASAYFATRQIANATEPVVVVFLKDMSLAESWAEDIPFFHRLLGYGKLKISLLYELPDDETSELRAFDQECDRITALTHLLAYKKEPKQTEKLLVLTTPHAFFLPVPPAEQLQKSEIHLEAGQEYSFKKLSHQLATVLNYSHEAVCETPGQYAVRGGIIDIYPVNSDRPFRIDFFGDEIESIRCFDPTTQRSDEAATTLTIALSPEKQEAQNKADITQYLGTETFWIFHDPSQLQEQYKNIFTVFERSNSQRPGNLEYLFEQRNGCADHFLALGEFEASSGIFEDLASPDQEQSESLETHRKVIVTDYFGKEKTAAESEAREAFLATAKQWQKKGDSVLLMAPNEAELARIGSIIKESKRLVGFKPQLLTGPVRKGFRIREGDHHCCVITSNDIFFRHRIKPAYTRRRQMPNHSHVEQLLDFSELSPGEHLVHLSHGICIFRGIQKLKINGAEEEVLSLEFDNALTIHLRLHESHLLTRYVGLSKQAPKLGKPGSGSWSKTRQAAEEATLDFAAKLLQTQATRKTGGGVCFEIDSEWQKEFEAAFEHEETPDQLRAINEAKEDMESPVAMDRLICGDVGFGKTEVAIRAAFKSVMSGKQAAILVPTTVLAQQHYNTFSERMAGYPISVEMLSRFRNPSQKKEILKKLKDGSIDIIVGTHSLLGKEVHFSDLGLLVIDEEHRFGVTHKERLKHLKENLDVITMSATPIPRTLYMALMGARDLSVIETPPVDRLPIQTLIKNYDEEWIKRAIEFELRRGGQVFYLHNRVQTIESVTEKLRRLVPEAKIGMGHGQMSENELEDIMTRFVAGAFNVLVCTTIIESGLDIPNCNTIIIEGADRFGLSQLYQLRGRVGRFKRQAYAYLLLHKNARMLDQARKRLSAIRQYNQLGSGFKIAMRDLELRGAGNILGAQQSGHIAGVGFDLYCQLLRQSISRLKGEAQAAVIRANVSLDFVHLSKETPENQRAKAPATPFDEPVVPVEKISACLPADYISETRLRIDFYRKLALSTTLPEVDEIGETLHDRFGKLPESVLALIELTKIRILAEQNSILSVESDGNILRCRLTGGGSSPYIKVGNRFPRLTRRNPQLRLQEIKLFLQRYQDHLL
ncbi:MAG: transcription-repair coupling factor [Opitutales bacterium]|nr:transcription-repair coupling factor [Opitutales bacterium]